MKNTQLRTKACFKCSRFKAYYTKGLSRFARAKVGYCKFSKIIVENSSLCENRCYGSKRLYASKKASMDVLSDLLTSITGIRQILQEAQEEGLK